MKIELHDYWMGRDSRFRGQLTLAIQRNAAETVARADVLVAQMLADGVPLEAHPANLSLVSSGWRPPAVNAATPGAAARSKHMTGEAVDLYDPDGALDDWCMDHLDALDAAGLWLEHPSATKGWCHLQTQPPRSGRRVFHP